MKLNSSHLKCLGGLTPFHMVFGSMVRMEVDLGAANMINDVIPPCFYDTPEEYRERIQQTLKYNELIVKQARIATSPMDGASSGRLRREDIGVNDLVYVYSAGQSDGSGLPLKLQNRFTGPHRVVRAPGERIDHRGKKIDINELLIFNVEPKKKKLHSISAFNKHCQDICTEGSASSVSPIA